MNKHKFFIYLLVILGVITVLLVLGMVFTTPTKDFIENGPSNLLVFGFTIATLSLTIALTLNIMQFQDVYSRHQAIGGYFPSRDLDKVIHQWYKLRYLKKYNRAYPMKKIPKYTSNSKDAESLLRLLPDYDGFCIGNIAKGSFTCTYRYKGHTHSATSATRAMAISIAFLLSCGDSYVH